MIQIDNFIFTPIISPISQKIIPAHYKTDGSPLQTLISEIKLPSQTFIPQLSYQISAPVLDCFWSVFVGRPQWQ